MDKRPKNQIPIYNFFPGNNVQLLIENASNEAKMDSDNDSNETISSNVKDSWLKQFDWLEFNILDVMFCKLCIKWNPDDSQNSFIKGNRTYNKNTLKSHSTSNNHQTAIK
jgi:hypothetical protein